MRWSAIARRVSSSGMPWSRGRIHFLGWSAACCFALLSGPAWGQLLDTSDTAIAIDTNAVFSLNGRYPGAEGPANAVDGNPATKYLNFGREGSGLIVTPFAPIPVESFRITTANDAPGRD